MDSISTLFPSQGGVLPKWLLFLAVVSIGNSVQAYLTLHYTSQVYSGPDLKSASPATPLSGRTFGTWTFLTSIVRLYAAYHINERSWYDMATWTFTIAAFHFYAEWLYFKTTRWNRGLIGPIVVASISLPWMLLQRSHYVK
ncbi:ergosterol 28 [Rhizodiscina lignyota]|uniref:Ergosterol 28 n=1 Tax=Rhizodiscina lignyota TaxID=1504668 RepID=A0A9P4M5Y9_9PEZI|nr:ergosterol 28 [Rhizodiscina lignyota]